MLKDSDPPAYMTGVRGKDDLIRIYRMDGILGRKE